MKANTQKINWILDLLMLAGFLVSFFLDLTGLILHQWLGVLLAVLMVVHLLNHVDWVKGVLQRFFTRCSRRSRLYAVIDLLIMIGVVMILESGLIISTWFNFNLENYSTLSHLHIYLAVGTLVLITIKLGLHWRWIVLTAQKIFKPKASKTLSRTGLPVQQPALAPVSQPNSLSRRQFIATMGIVSLASALAIKKVLSNDFLDEANAAAEIIPTATVQEVAAVQSTSTDITADPTATAQASATATSVPAATASAEPTTTTAAAACVVRCNRGCVGRGCHRYTDQNGNGRCDYGECL